GGMFGDTPKSKETIILNTESSIIKKISELEEGDKCSLLCRHVYDLAAISQRKLTAAELEGFISRSVEVLNFV
ncbi:MAG: molecular chaperone HtpG, partial [Acutalibacteraceae bacterium]